MIFFDEDFQPRTAPILTKLLVLLTMDSLSDIYSSSQNAAFRDMDKNRF